VHREYFSIIFNAKKCALYSIKYVKLTHNYLVLTAPDNSFKSIVMVAWDTTEGAQTFIGFLVFDVMLSRLKVGALCILHVYDLTLPGLAGWVHEAVRNYFQGLGL
jgi:hypothetical protein